MKIKGTALVPCNGCRACCWFTVQLTQEETELYQQHEVRQDGKVVLLKNVDGSCIYLKSSGCSIYEHRPTVCKRFDCRATYLMSREPGVTFERGPRMDDVLDAGRVLLEVASARAYP